jgi:hypothetical protein
VPRLSTNKLSKIEGNIIRRIEGFWIGAAAFRSFIFGSASFARQNLPRSANPAAIPWDCTEIRERAMADLHRHHILTLESHPSCLSAPYICGQAHLIRRHGGPTDDTGRLSCRMRITAA